MQSPAEGSGKPGKDLLTRDVPTETLRAGCGNDDNAGVRREAVGVSPFPVRIGAPGALPGDGTPSQRRSTNQ
ncbi:hypothetical protein Cme02nite_48000 [Catellatospora methionotrophica]|uniref:Uncharacterized protein n=1 Tax=Catellatospora methionotrophica TaxID=121620 RepID=A0A8J3LDW5_9ACTN|nr:hypothetical protein Cme02nite_48000 [Catellatospora methionotrophica]